MRLKKEKKASSMETDNLFMRYIMQFGAEELPPRMQMPIVEEHIPCHKGAYMGKNGITRDRTGKLWYYRNLKR